MQVRPFLKWAGGKRWLLDAPNFHVPQFEGRYIEPFLGGGAIFFHLSPKRAILSDLNGRLIEVYTSIRDDWSSVYIELQRMQKLHCPKFYYEERARERRKPHTRAAQFLYLNRTCWNGLYRENLAGKFNVPIGSKSQVLLPDDDFASASKILSNAVIKKK
jgi:DNA adenine methylase